MNLQLIQKELKVPKSHRNTFANYDYRNAEDILEAVKPLLGDSILTLSDEIVQIGDRFYVKATATFIEISKGAPLPPVNSVTAYAREPLEKKGSDASQITGAASSYARKYALNGLFLIDDTKDADDDSRDVAMEKLKTAAEPSQTRHTAPTATKPAKPDISKDRIVFLLKSLGFKGTTKNEYTAAVYEMTGLHLVDVNYEKIANTLAAKLEAEEAAGEQ